MQTFQQKVAQRAYQDVYAVQSKIDASYEQKYLTMARKFPMLIHSTGLAQAVVFLQARGEDAHKDLLDQVARSLEIQGINNGTDLMKECSAAPLNQYIYLTRRVLTTLLWYKRFAEALLDPEETKKKKDGAQKKEAIA